MSKQTRTVLISVVATLLVVVILQNLRDANVRFILWQFSMPLTVLLLLVFGGGVLAGWLWRRK